MPNDSKSEAEQKLLEELPKGIRLNGLGIRIKNRFSKHRSIMIEETGLDVSKNDEGEKVVKARRAFVGGTDKATQTPAHMRKAKSRSRNEMSKASRKRNRRKR